MTSDRSLSSAPGPRAQSGGEAMLWARRPKALTGKPLTFDVLIAAANGRPGHHFRFLTGRSPKSAGDLFHEKLLTKEEPSCEGEDHLAG